MPELLAYRIDKSRESIRQMLSLSKNPYLALSFGKDSLVMLDLVREQYPDIPCLFLKSEETFLMYNYEEVIKEYIEQGVNLTLVETNRLSENAMDWEKARKKGNQDFLLDAFFDGWDGVFMGLRIEESKARRYSLTRKQSNNAGQMVYQYTSGKRKGMYRCCPLAFWKEHEIMVYLEERGLPYLDVYKEGSHIRTTARITGDAARQNALHWVKKNNPENWNKLKTLIPELNDFI